MYNAHIVPHCQAWTTVTRSILCISLFGMANTLAGLWSVATWRVLHTSLNEAYSESRVSIALE